MKTAHFSTDAHPAPEALGAWCSFYSRKVMAVTMQAPKDAASAFAARVLQMPGMLVAFINSTPNTIVRSKAQAMDGNSDYLLVVPTKGSAHIAAHGKQVFLEAGDATLLAANAPSTSTITTVSSLLTLAIPAVVLGPALANIEGALGSLIPATTDVLQLLVGYLSSLSEDITLSDPSVRQVVVSHVYSLVALAIGSGEGVTLPRPVEAVHAAKLAALKSDILPLLGRHDLSVESIAAQRGVSGRYIRRLFELNGETFREYVLVQRLERAHAVLADVREAHRPIGSIALESGFSDLSYFNRAFRRRYRATPSDVRRAALDTARNLLLHSIDSGASAGSGEPQS